MTVICRDDLPETPDWTLPPRHLWALTEQPVVTIASAELDPLGTE